MTIHTRERVTLGRNGRGLTKLKDMELFEKLTTSDFNSHMGTQLNRNMSFHDSILNIENNHVQYFYVSMEKQDVLDAINDEKETADQLKLWLVFILDMGIYIAIYE